MKLVLPLLAALAVAPGLIAQSNKVPGRDATLRIVDTLQSYGRQGAFPNGINGLANGVTVCNIGTGNISWQAPMNSDHPVYAPMVFRVTDDRIEQISGWSHVKHGFSSINGSACGQCGTGDSRLLGPNCSDTYGSGLNADRFWLGPPEEIDPWLGTWDPVASYFDRGDPDVGLPRNRDGLRSLQRSMTDPMPAAKNRVAVSDADLSVAGARFFYGMYVVVEGEPSSARENNWCYREFRPTLTGSSWAFADLSAPTNAAPLEFWPGARVSSGGAGNDDGMFYVGMKVSGPDERGLWHYEYAVLNRDAARAGASFRLPICPTTRILNPRFRDIDGDMLNQWTVSVQNGEVAFFAPATGNVLEWNTIYNFSFDADAGPVPGDATVDLARMGTGVMTVTIPTQVPGISFSPNLGAGCGTPAPALFATGTPPFAVIPNPSFGLRVEDLPPNGSAAVLVSLQTGNTTLGNGCTLWLDASSAIAVGTFGANAQGVATVPFGVPNDVSLEGASVAFQAATLVSGGPLFGQIALSNGMRVRIGNQTTGCR